MICYYSQDDRASVFDRSSTLKTTTISANKQQSSMEQKRSNFEAEFLSHERSSEILLNDMEHMFFVCASRDEHSTWIYERCTSLWSMGTLISSSFEFRPFLWFAKIIPIALSLLVFYYCCVPFNFNKKRRLKENCTTSLRRIIIMRMLRGEGELRKTRLRPRVWEDSTLLWEQQQHPHGLSRQAACKEHEWDLCVSVKFSLFWNMKQVFYAQRSSIVPSFISWWIQQIAPSKKSLKSISHLSVQCSMCAWGESHIRVRFYLLFSGLHL